MAYCGSHELTVVLCTAATRLQSTPLHTCHRHCCSSQRGCCEHCCTCSQTTLSYTGAETVKWSGLSAHCAQSTVEDGCPFADSLISLQELLCLCELFEARPLLGARACRVLPHELDLGLSSAKWKVHSTACCVCFVRVLQPGKSSYLVRLGVECCPIWLIATVLLEPISSRCRITSQATPQHQALAK